MLKLKLQYFGHLMRRVDSLEKTDALEGLGAGGEGDDRGWDGWMASPTWWTWVWTPGVCDGQGDLACCNSWGGKESDTTEWLNWLTDVQYETFQVYNIMIHNFFKLYSICNYYKILAVKNRAPFVSFLRLIMNHRSWKLRRFGVLPGESSWMTLGSGTRL